MAEGKKKVERLTTPKGIAKYPWLNKPNQKFNADGEYKVSLLLPKDDPATQELCKRLDQKADEKFNEVLADLSSKPQNKKKAETLTRNDPYTPEVDEEGNETGNLEFKFKMKARVQCKDGSIRDLKPRLFDAKAKPLTDGVAIYGGSTLKVNFTPSPYYIPSSNQAGVSLQMNAVQVIELVQSGSDGGFYGFGEEEGFSQEEESVAEDTAATDASASNEEVDF